MTALNFPDSPSNGDTYQGYTYNSTKSAWAKPDSPDPEARTAVYANIAALPTSGTAGDMAYVTATNRLYIWTGTGWYNIALINTNPTISGVSSSYALAIDGTATTVTITASDPEGLPITYSIVSDTSGNSATVAQGTGSNTNVFTVTPSTNTAHAGTFSLTFRASDGVNIASSAASFTLQFKVVNQNYTTALITSVGTNNAVNNSFDDKSTNDHTITTVGDSHQTTFSPYRHGGYSTYFDGSGDYLQPAGTTIFDISSSTASFTVEAWINPPALPSAGAYNYRFGSIISKAVVYVSFGFTNNGTLRFYTYNGAQNYINSAAGVIETGKWQHVALVSDAGSITIYKDGVSVATGTLAAPSSNAIGVAPKIATADTGQAADYINSYVTDLRVVDGTAVYTSAFTPPTERLTAITNTSLLACHLPYIADGSTTGHSITVYGNTKTQPFAPYDAQEYAAADHGGSAHFDGSGDYLHMPQTSLDLGSDDFCVEAWVYTTSTGNQAIIGSYRYADGVGSWNLNVNYNSQKLRFFIRHSGGSVIDGQFESGTFPTNQWVHVAVTRDGSNLRAFINGTQAGTTNTALGSNSIDNASVTYRIGASNDNNIYWNGSITDARVVKGSSVYTADFTPTTTPLTAITNTIFLAQNTDAGIIDKAQSVKSMNLKGDIKSSTTQTKYLSSSMYFDGTGDYIHLDNILSGYTGDFTIETWIYHTSFSSPNSNIYSCGGAGSLGADMFEFSVNGSSKLQVFWGSGYAPAGITTDSVPGNTWYHAALVRNGTASNNCTLYVDGVSKATFTKTSAFPSPSSANLTFIGTSAYAPGAAGRSMVGYMSDYRITKGLARYTANFTAPTVALQG